MPVVADPGADTASRPGAGDTWTEPTTDMAFVWVPKGCFQMGSPKSEKGRDDDERQHEVCVEGFWLGKYEVTNAQYRHFRSGHDSGGHEGRPLDADEQPVVSVSWHEAVAYAEWLSTQTGHRFRLPTEAEWEYASRAGTASSRYWGDDPDKACSQANVHDETSKRENAFPWIHHRCDDGHTVSAPVGRFKPNGYGLYDMLGNVGEWTCSAYERNYGGEETRCADKGWRVYRGSSWVNVPRGVRAAFREWLTPAPGSRHFSIGFRLARMP